MLCSVSPQAAIQIMASEARVALPCWGALLLAARTRAAAARAALAQFQALLGNSWVLALSRHGEALRKDVWALAPMAAAGIGWSQKLAG